MSEIRLKDNESLDNALKRFKRQCAKSGVMGELRKREHYDKPSVKRKKKSEAARKENSDKTKESILANTLFCILGNINSKYTKTLRVVTNSRGEHCSPVDD